MPELVLLCDKEVAAMLGISTSCLRKWLRDGPPSRATFDIREVEHIVIGESRRWNRASLIATINKAAKASNQKKGTTK